MTTEIEVANQPSSLIQARGEELEVSAFHPQQMLNANHALIAWTDRKIASLKAESIELHSAWQRAVKIKWKPGPMKRLYDMSMKRISFYEKMKAALEAGFYIVPNFPVTCFAVRTEKDKPMKLASFRHWDTHEQKAETLPAGQGDYKNPFPEVWSLDLTSEADKAKNQKKLEYYAKDWDDMEFPINMAKPMIMEATGRANPFSKPKTQTNHALQKRQRSKERRPSCHQKL